LCANRERHLSFISSSLFELEQKWNRKTWGYTSSRVSILKIKLFKTWILTEWKHETRSRFWWRYKSRLESGVCPKVCFHINVIPRS
jgi:hypothetical protein